MLGRRSLREEAGGDGPWLPSKRVLSPLHSPSWPVAGGRGVAEGHSPCDAAVERGRPAKRHGPGPVELDPPAPSQQGTRTPQGWSRLPPTLSVAALLLLSPFSAFPSVLLHLLPSLLSQPLPLPSGLGAKHRRDFAPQGSAGSLLPPSSPGAAEGRAKCSGLICEGRQARWAGFARKLLPYKQPAAEATLSRKAPYGAPAAAPRCPRRWGCCWG